MENTAETKAVKIGEKYYDINTVTELAEQLADKYMSTPNKDILPFLAYLYSLDVEIAHGFLKMYKANKPEEYRRLADVDDKLNDKKLFKKFVQLIK